MKVSFLQSLLPTKTTALFQSSKKVKATSKTHKEQKFKPFSKIRTEKETPKEIYTSLNWVKSFHPQKSNKDRISYKYDYTLAPDQSEKTFLQKLLRKPNLHVTKVIHHDYLPAVIRSNGDKEYWQNGILHREKKPAIISDIGNQWWENGVKYRFETDAVIKHYDKQTGFLQDPDKNTPAVIGKRGGFQHYSQGVLHREDGPAMRTVTGKNYYYFQGKELSFQEWIKHVKK